MKFSARKFNKDSYDKNDTYAKKLFSRFLIRKGHSIYRVEENFQHDLITNKDNYIYFFELEVKTNYPFTTSETFKFDTVSFLGRKKRLHDIKPYYYVIICRETEHALMCYSTDIFKDEYIESINIHTNHRSGADQMYRVPKAMCRFFNLNE